MNLEKEMAFLLEKHYKQSLSDNIKRGIEWVKKRKKLSPRGVKKSKV